MDANIVRFLESTDEFYEGAYMNQTRFVPRRDDWLAGLPLWLINSGYLWHVRRNIPPGSSVLELGCAGGVAYFAQRYRMLGLDVSLSALRSVSPIYQQCLQADAARGIPLPDRSLDGLISSYFWEHMPWDSKKHILDQCRRVLRPGGKLVFLYDVETSNPLISRLRGADEDLYQERFIKGDGHLGYHTLDANDQLFKESGFRVCYHTALERSLLHSPSVFEKMTHWSSRGLRAAGRLHILGNSRLLLLPYTALVRLFDSTFGRLLPRKWARIALTVCERA